MSADDPAALDLAPIRARLATVNQERWARNTEPAIDPRFLLGTFIAHAPTDIAALLLEIERLRAENSGLWETLVSDSDEELAQLGADFVKEWSNGL